MNKPIHQPINQSSNQSINQLTNQQIYQEKVHTFKCYDAAGIRNNAVIFLRNNYRGGAGKRGRVEEAEDIKHQI